MSSSRITVVSKAGDESAPPHLEIVAGLDIEENNTGIPATHRGLRFMRTLKSLYPEDITTPVEEALARLWSDRNIRNSLLGQLLSADRDNPRRGLIPVTDREWDVAHLVAATLIQWLATQEGCWFLEEAFKKSGGELTFRLPAWVKSAS